MKILSLLRGLSGTAPIKDRYDDGEIARWVVDPLSHPVLDTMSERELGDMPFRLTAGRTAYETAGAGYR
ncbi:hypothetical protein [Mesorhizobium sp.]|uniref:hypothetical protein n=1 Tax=Mesorhizobium sp. TaxID=1871066 RepID=UPI000FEA04B5|nr:hypothetical protein [Mesorhizobium sp.]RWM31832.1 MAG: hypothetical protein EOR74_01415 [Mesorhizobium sp.]RWM39696.1 MAG: hypothetical protein EOR75_12880 [Mesorhizobium sp.]TIO77355.1 MAG: hypothetical protein E5X75_11045 [Mesorhizobium sp.]TIO86201.1 MAG: hypothetical protein E5X74_08500 [Mesorhizobium sp.]TJV53706.1 MAG: hypothetical protein E5Y01_05260 [Mesorhizobium sp.]